jgi:DNA-binding phage protein
MLGDILKSERKVSTPGKRPSLTKSDGINRLNKILDRDYSSFEFQKAFKVVSNGRSIRSIHAKTGLSKSHVQRLLSGQDNPSIETLEKIARSFDKHPSYFLEYRIYKVLESFNNLMMQNPETATNWYKKILGQ